MSELNFDEQPSQGHRRHCRHRRRPPRRIIRYEFWTSLYYLFLSRLQQSALLNVGPSLEKPAFGVAWRERGASRVGIEQWTLDMIYIWQLLKLYLLQIVESFENYMYCEALSLIDVKLCSAFMCSNLSWINGIIVAQERLPWLTLLIILVIYHPRVIQSVSEVA